MPWLPAPGARELLRPSGTAGLGWAGLPFPSPPRESLWQRQSPPCSPQHPWVSPPTPSAARCGSVRGFGQPPLPAGGSALPVYSPRTLPAESRRETLSFALPKQAHVQVSPASLSLALPAGLRNFCRGSAGLYLPFF